MNAKEYSIAVRGVINARHRALFDGLTSKPTATKKSNALAARRVAVSVNRLYEERISDG